MLAVIALHVSAQHWYSVDIHTFSWCAFDFYDCLVRFAVPVFTAISGALFLDPDRSVSVQAIHRKNIRKIIIVYIFWSAFYAAFSNWSSLLTRDGAIFFLISVVNGHYHMWFLPMLVGLYLITPILRKITTDRNTTKYFVALYFLFSIFIPTLLQLMRLVGLPSIGINALSGLYANANLISLTCYPLYFVLGHYLNKTSIGKRSECILYALGLIGFASTVLLSKAAFFQAGAATEQFHYLDTLNVFLEVVSVFTFAKCRLSKWLRGERTAAVIRKLSKYSFGVYLIHPFFITTLARFGLDTLSFNAALSVPAITAIVFVLSLITSAILNKIPIVKKYLV